MSQQNSRTRQQWRPFEEARAYAQAQGFTTIQQWKEHVKARKKPRDIPSDPSSTYGSAFRGWEDWLGKPGWRPFEEARAFVHGLGLKNVQAWEAYSRSGKRPTDIPSAPYRSYQGEFQGWDDWLGLKRWRPFEEARAFARAQGFTTMNAWMTYARSGARPIDIPTNPPRIYRREFQGWDDWLGVTRRAIRRWRLFSYARAYVHTLGFHTRKEWMTYAHSGVRPTDIPSHPQLVYQREFQGWEDWLGLKGWRPFEEARAFARALGFTSKVQWEVYAASEDKPADIPSDPKAVYDEFKEYQDWLGMRKPGTGWRPFEEARAYAQAQGFTTIQQWKEHSKARKKPRDIPSDPPSAYGSAFRGWEDWLGKPGWRPFEEARAFARTLGFTSKEQWVAYAKSKEKPSDIPSSPADTYGSAFRGYQDWLGIINLWNKKALLALLQDLRASIASLQEHELYAILDRSGAFPGLCGVLQTSSTQRVFRDLRENGGRVLEAQLTATANGSERQPLIAFDETLVPIIDIDVSRDASRSCLATEEGWRALDTLASLPSGLDDELIESLIASRVSALWERHAKEGGRSVDAFLSKSGGNVYFEEIKRRYLAEKTAVEMLPVPPGWAFTDDQGTLCAPNLMQRRVAWLVRERGRVGNWSGVGTGKRCRPFLHPVSLMRESRC